MSGLLIRLAGPMQSWGDHSTFSDRDTRTYPTRSGLIGLIAAADGRGRREPIDDLSPLSFTIRVDRPGVPMMDFHTIGGGLPVAQTVPTAQGKRRQDDSATIVSRRYYLADAVFTVAVTGPDQVVASAAAVLRDPVWAPYLGRRSCPAEQPLLLAEPLDDPIGELVTRVPLARRPPKEDEWVDVDFVYEKPPADRPTAARLSLNDVPVDFSPARRRYLSRSAYVVQTQLPAALCAQPGKYLDALASYLEESAT